MKPTKWQVTKRTKKGLEMLKREQWRKKRSFSNNESNAHLQQQPNETTTVQGGTDQPPTERSQPIFALDVDNMDTGGTTVQKGTENNTKENNLNKDKYNYILPSCVNDRENPKSVKSKLKQSYLFWKNELNAPENVLSVISKGYCLPIIDTPNQRVFENNKSATENCEFVTNSIKELLNDGSVKEMPYAPHIVSPLSVSKNSSGKTRLILDLRYLNNHLYKDRIKFNDWRVFKDLISENGFMFKFDLKKGYHHIDIFEKHQQFLGFSWSENLIKKYYVFTVLPFGLSTAPSIFTRMLRPLTSYWHNQGIKICLYIDDGAATDKSFKKAMLHSNIVKSTLEQAGFVINVEKSTWVPQRNIIWLGIEVDFVKNCFYISKQRIDSIKQLCEKITTKKFTTTRDLSKLTGSIVSTKFVLKDIINLKTRNLYNLIENRISWDAKI